MRQSVWFAALSLLVASLVAASAAAGLSRADGVSYAYVALGDSFSAGEGLAPYLPGGLDPVTRPRGTVANGCHRSARSYPTWVRPPRFEKSLFAIASGAGKAGAGNRYRSGRNVRTGGLVTWASWACSGATTSSVLPGSLGGRPQVGFGEAYDLRTQLDSARLADADLVTLTIGGNDAGYIEVLVACGLGNCRTRAFRQRRTAIIDAVKPRLERVYRAIAARATHARILVLGYPQLFPASRAEQACVGLKPFLGEQDMLRRLGSHLNDTIHSAVTSVARSGARVEFVPVAARFAGHEVCGRKGPWMNGFLTSRNGFGVDPGSFHPNLLGQRAGYGAAANAALR